MLFLQLNSVSVGGLFIVDPSGYASERSFGGFRRSHLGCRAHKLMIRKLCLLLDPDLKCIQIQMQAFNDDFLQKRIKVL